ncbi:MAG: DUF3892 domain-containing protein [Candidatus Alcyoniella australis]|nr:DUF3892 domain-containing protein [Candidatus Alcyoniella australis]
MADYYIKCQKKAPDGSIIALGMSSSLRGPVSMFRKASVVALVREMKISIWTALLEDGKWIEGEQMRTVEGRYLRTDRNDTPLDNLGELPDLRLND